MGSNFFFLYTADAEKFGPSAFVFSCYGLRIGVVGLAVILDIVTSITIASS